MDEFITLSPLPPPPFVAFKITGYPILSASSVASSNLDTSFPSATEAKVEAYLFCQNFIA